MFIRAAEASSRVTKRLATARTNLISIRAAEASSRVTKRRATARTIVLVGICAADIQKGYNVPGAAENPPEPPVAESLPEPPQGVEQKAPIE